MSQPTRRRPRRGGPPLARAWRIPALLALLGLAVVGGLIDRAGHPAPAAAALPSSVANGVPHTASAGSLSSSWYCTGATAVSGGQANGSVLISNLGSHPLAGMVKAVPSAGTPVSRAVTVPARATVAVANSTLVQAPFVSDTVVLAGGQAVVSQTVSGPLGTSSAACASSIASRWYLADGSTLEGDDVYLSLFNPGATDAVADLSFATDQGPSAPGDFQGVVVPAGTMLPVDVRSHVQNRTSVASTVSARVGRLVVAELSVQTAKPPSGTSLVLGTPSTATRWVFPYGTTGSGQVETYHVYNPSATPAQVSVDFLLAKGAAEPLRITVGPQSAVQVTANDQARVPMQVTFSTSVTSLNGVGVVAERSIALSPPVPITGRASMLGARMVGASWAVSSGGVPGTATSEALIVSNLSTRAATVSFEAVSGGSVRSLLPPGKVRLQAGQIVAVPVPPGPELEHAAYLVRSSDPLLVERDLYPAASPGLSVALGSLLL